MKRLFVYSQEQPMQWKQGTLILMMLFLLQKRHRILMRFSLKDWEMKNGDNEKSLIYQSLTSQSDSPVYSYNNL
jgi:hypothetical protein